MNNFPFKYNGQTLWYSRSLAASCVVFGYNRYNKVCVLVNKRGDGCEYNVGMWNIPGGFVDFNETAEETAVRELFEETGVMISSDELSLVELDTTPIGARQTMSATYVHRLPDKINVEDIKTTTYYCEPGEVSEIKWVPVEDLEKYGFVRGHIKRIKEALLQMYH